MPVNKIDYSKTIIYRIVCKDTNITDCYIGQTTDFRSRKHAHKNNCKNENIPQYNFYIYQFIRENGGFENWDMIEIEKYFAIDKLDSHKRERYWIEFYKSTLNKVIPLRTQKEYKEQNREQILDKSNQYYEENREQIIKNNKEYYKENKEQVRAKQKEKITCDCGYISMRCTLSQHKKSKKHLDAINNICVTLIT